MLRKSIGTGERHFPPEHIANRLSYNPETGEIRWKDGQRAGMLAGAFNSRGYLEIRMGAGSGHGVLLLGHRVAWCIATGDWPSETVDHINRNSSDNRWTNLRAADMTLQQRNRSTDGVCFCKQTGKWKAYLSIGPKQLWLGRHPTREAALKARKEGESRYWSGNERVA